MPKVMISIKKSDATITLEVDGVQVDSDAWAAALSSGETPEVVFESCWYKKTELKPVTEYQWAFLESPKSE